MNLLKKLFPDYESKSEMKSRLEKQISYLEGFNRSAYVQIERDVIQVGASIEIGEREILGGVPMDIIKEQLLRKLSQEMKQFVEFDVNDCPDYARMSKVITGKIYVSCKK